MQSIGKKNTNFKASIFDPLGYSCVSNKGSLQNHILLRTDNLKSRKATGLVYMNHHVDSGIHISM